MNKNYLFIAAILVAATVLYHEESTSNDVSMTQYLTYLKAHSKSIPNGQEFIYRSKIYANNIQKINKHNSDNTQTWQMGVNQFADITQQQFISLYLGEMPFEVKEINEPVNAGFGGEIDWRNKGVVTKVKNQGSCGSCWAFAATAAHESYQIQFKNQPATLDLSQQQLVDCSGISPYENHGCNGGYAIRGLQYVKDFGQATQEQYPYTAKTGDSCLLQGGKYRPFGTAEARGCEQIETLIARRPVAVRVDASNWHLYKSGIFDNCAKNINHAVFLVGSSQTSWTIKNSWTATWGETGYIRLAKGDTCAVCQGPSFAL